MHLTYTLTTGDQLLVETAALWHDPTGLLVARAEILVAVHAIYQPGVRLELRISLDSGDDSGPLVVTHPLDGGARVVRQVDALEDQLWCGWLSTVAHWWRPRSVA